MNKKHECCGLIWSAYGHRKCGNNASMDHDGKHYCKLHHPPTVEARNKAKRTERQAKWEASREERRKKEQARAEQERRASLYPELLDALIALLGVAPSKAPGAGLIVGAEEKHANALQAARAAIKKATGDA